MSSENNSNIIIDLKNIRAKKHHFNKKDKTVNHILLKEYYDKIIGLVSDRIKEVKDYQNQGFDIDNINEVKMHDAILVYGSRGNGKSTIMINLQDFIIGEEYNSNKEIESSNEIEKVNGKIKVFETVDPTIQEEDEDFLLVILSAILKEVEEYDSNNNKDRNEFYSSLENVLQIVQATRSKNKDNIDIFDKFYGLKSGVGLAIELHNLFKYTKEIFDVDILIVPIDDVDMNLKQGYQIADSIRKYMSSPYIIPIVAFNIRQMRVVTKHNKYKEFGISIYNKIEDEELSFLRALPSDYLSKVFPPNRRIYLKSVFEILKDSESGGSSNIIFKMDENIQIDSFSMTCLISEMIYESYYRENRFKDVDNSVFLSNRSMRNFLNDCYCILSSLYKKENSKNYSINWTVIKNRFAPDDMNAFVTKEHALSWLWHEYIDVAKRSLQNRNSVHKNYNWARVVTDTLPEDNSAEIINKKSYARIWIQEYYREDSIGEEDYSTFIKNSKNTYTFHKKCNIVGALELAMRSYIPMYLFEGIVKNHNLKYENCDLTSLQNFTTKSLLDISYELSMMEVNLFKGSSKEFTPKPIGSLNVSSYQKMLKDKEINIPFLFKVLNQEKIHFTDNKQIYIISIFKSIAFFIELSKISLEKDKKIKKSKKYKALIERYRINIPEQKDGSNITSEYYKNFKSIDKEFKALIISFEKSSFGILEIASFSKKLVNYFINIRDNIEDSNLSNFKSEEDINKEDINRNLPINALATYFTSFGQALFISLFNSVKTNDMLCIKDKNNKKEKHIYTKHSIYGVKKKFKKNKKVNLYVKNISNLTKISKEDAKKDTKNINYDVNNLFKLINEDIPFYKYLINESEFLSDLEDIYKEASSNEA